jgi:hypothetical protein
MMSWHWDGAPSPSFTIVGVTDRTDGHGAFRPLRPSEEAEALERYGLSTVDALPKDAVITEGRYAILEYARRLERS